MTTKVEQHDKDIEKLNLEIRDLNKNYRDLIIAINRVANRQESEREKILALVENQILRFERRLPSGKEENEKHCSITDKHFHEQEHGCSICDFTITDSNSLPNSDIVFIVSSQSFSFSSFTESVNIPFAFSNLPSRAPPIA